ncbi:beta-N-acetylhexosaminidase [Oceanivirga salmonicida]|uniref:beta-N-acetylhexosaminidase n=1 Tax=Oceanivirga salmonicida TaxID=1769291 RepID=UPI0012E2D06B|nr:beta-N-acetylhexosaminidase [Oceanivirga salmonicida]
MFKINICKLPVDLQDALKVLEKKNYFKVSLDGLEIIYTKTDDNLVLLDEKDNKLNIKSSDKAGFFRALSQYLFNNKKINTKRNFEKLGLMIDNSRNGVTNVEYTKSVIENIAFMGMNTLYLYLEDTYILEEEPYFGHLRGAYTKAELKELDDYAYMFGIELVPCIQALAHINQFFYWEHISRKYADLDDILCVGDTNVLKLIENMIKHFSNTLRTRRIHLGMDEAYNLGRGRYADINGLKEKPYIMLEHLKDMLRLCDKYGMKPMIWDDMFFSNYAKLSENDKDFYIPDGISLMYWDYYNSKKEHYIERFKQRKSISNDVLFAGGAWRWTGYTPHHSKTKLTLNASMSACVEENIKEVLITSWADDGTESPVFNEYLGCLIAADKSYNDNSYEKDCIKYIGIDIKDYMSTEKLDFVENTDKDYTPSKYFFYEDLLMSKFVYHNSKIKEDLTIKYAEYEELYKNLENKYNDNELLKTYFAFYNKYAKILKYKWNLSTIIYEAYNKNDKETLKKCITKIDKLIEILPELQIIRKKLWYIENKRYGLEVLEQRFGGMLLRFISVKQDLLSYIKSDIKIDELDEKRLALDEMFEGQSFIHYNRAQRMVSASKMIW